MCCETRLTGSTTGMLEPPPTVLFSASCPSRSNSVSRTCSAGRRKIVQGSTSRTASVKVRPAIAECRQSTGWQQLPSRMCILLCMQPGCNCAATRCDPEKAACTTGKGQNTSTRCKGRLSFTAAGSAGMQCKCMSVYCTCSRKLLPLRGLV